jgi:hypothetical protein
MEIKMFRVYIIMMSLLIIGAVLCIIRSDNTPQLALGLVLLVIGAGGLSAGIMSRADSH